MDLDIATLARDVMLLLTPYLPYLTKGLELAGQEAAKTLGEEATKQVINQVKAIWDRLRQKESVAQVAQTAAKLPDNTALLEALRQEIARALESDPALREEIARMVQPEVVQRVLAEGNSRIADVEQHAQGGPTHQQVIARGNSEIRRIKQIGGKTPFNV